MTTGIRTPFDFSSTADDVIDGIDLSGRRAIVTGGSSGIGVETARAPASAGAEVTLAVRPTAAGDQVAAELVRSTGNEAIFVQPLELSALTLGLHDALAAARGARIVSVSSSGNLFSPVVFDDLHFDFRPYDPFVAYGQSKSADALLAVEATRRCGPAHGCHSGVTGISARTVVPRPGGDVTSIRPPSAWTRSARPASPLPAARAALACLTVFVRASDTKK
jgi:NAD(P)-dependent dehydrogenase (short-subunit alcohol dehydrogenase family)